MKLSENSLRVLRHRYLKKDKSGKVVETPEQMFRRVARTVAGVEASYGASAKRVKRVEKKFYEMMARLDFLPNSPTLANAGNPLGMLSACFVLPVGDSLQEIFDSVKLQALIQQSGGGTGMDYSRIRPRGERVMTTKGTASGPVSFMRVFDVTTEAIKQGGMRRGANMGILRVDHPDIVDFITCKSDMKSLTNFNISVSITDKFMQAVEKNASYYLTNPVSKKPVARLKARKVWNLLISEAWRNGDPGIIFIDEINRFNPTPGVGRIEATNPCSEVPLLAFESCNLGSINVANFYDDGKNDVDWAYLAEVVHTGVRFLDNVIDANKYPDKGIEQMTRGNRKIGLGVMGFAQLLFQKNMKYDSEQGVGFGEKLMKFISQEADAASLELGKQRGPFDFWNRSIYAKAGQRFRNATRTCIAPTGTISMIADCSSGIEPLFALSFVKKVMEGQELVYVDPFFEKVAKQGGFHSDSLMKRLSRTGSVAKIKNVPPDVRKIFTTAFDVSPYWHVAMQAAFQKYTGLAVSKTVNFPASSTKKDVEKVYWLAHRMKCKGITIYRDKSRSTQVLNIGKTTCPRCEGEIAASHGAKCGHCKAPICAA